MIDEELIIDVELETDNNVIEFPVKNPRAAELGDLLLDRQREMTDSERIKMDYTDDVVDSVLPILFVNLEKYGIGLEERLEKDAAMIVESVKSYVAKSLGLHHPLQDNVEESFQILN